MNKIHMFLRLACDPQARRSSHEHWVYARSKVKAPLPRRVPQYQKHSIHVMAIHAAVALSRERRAQLCRRFLKKKKRVAPQLQRRSPGLGRRTGRAPPLRAGRLDRALRLAGTGNFAAGLQHLRLHGDTLASASAAFHPDLQLVVGSESEGPLENVVPFGRNPITVPRPRTSRHRLGDTLPRGDGGHQEGSKISLSLPLSCLLRLLETPQIDLLGTKLLEECRQRQPRRRARRNQFAQIRR